MAAEAVQQICSDIVKSACQKTIFFWAPKTYIKTDK